MMVLIVSRYDDASANNVVDWLLFYGVSVVRITPRSDFRLVSIGDGYDITFSIDGEIFKASEISFYWFRNGRIPLVSPQMPRKSHFYMELQLNVDEEYHALLDMIYYRFDSLPRLNARKDSIPNKMVQLELAEKVGLFVPKMIVATTKVQVVSFFGKEKTVLTKPFQVPFYYRSDLGHVVQTYSTLVDIEELEEEFQPSLFQEYIDKEFEIRTFYLDGDFFSMAILSQGDEQTMVDFRRYNDLFPNRTIAYQLPIEIKNKIGLLMKKLGLVTGSLDIILTKSGDFYFLEVNPSGQYGMVSTPCNYNLDKHIAEYIIRNGKK